MLGLCFLKIQNSCRNYRKTKTHEQAVEQSRFRADNQGMHLFNCIPCQRWESDLSWQLEYHLISLWQRFKVASSTGHDIIVIKRRWNMSVNLHYFHSIVFRIFRFLESLVHLHLAGGQGSLMIQLFQWFHWQECPTERDFIMQRIVNEIARKAEQHMGFGRGLDGETAEEDIWSAPFLEMFFSSQNC